MENMTRPEDTRTERELVKEAWACQDACNLSGVVHSFSRAMARLWQLHNAGELEEKTKGTNVINRHIVSKLFAYKIVSLAGDLPIELPAYLFE